MGARWRQEGGGGALWQLARGEESPEIRMLIHETAGCQLDFSKSKHINMKNRFNV
jgi:hypothetical protein